MLVEAHQFGGVRPLCSDYDIEVTVTPDPCVGAVDDSLEENDDCSAAATVTDGLESDLFVSKTDPDFYALCLESGASLQVDILFDTGVADLDMFLWDASSANCGGPNGGLALALSTSSTNDEAIAFTNTTGASLDLILEVRVWSLSNGDCNRYDMQLLGVTCPGLLPTFCFPMDPNSTGASTNLTGQLGTGTGSDLHLDAEAGPPDQFGYFLVGTGFEEPGIPLGQGRFCLAVSGSNQFGRYNVNGSVLNSLGRFDAQGDLQNVVGTSSGGAGYDVPSGLPLAGTPTIASGETWHFQLWHREAGGGSNFSNGLSVTF